MKKNRQAEGPPSTPVIDQACRPINLYKAYTKCLHCRHSPSPNMFDEWHHDYSYEQSTVASWILITIDCLDSGSWTSITVGAYCRRQFPNITRKHRHQYQWLWTVIHLLFLGIKHYPALPPGKLTALFYKHKTLPALRGKPATNIELPTSS